MKSLFKLSVFIISILPTVNYAQEINEDHREKVYIQLDKPFYSQSDIVRFQVIVLDAENHQPTEISDIAYAELISPNGSVVKKLTLPIVDGTARGDFDLPDKGGLYLLKAYTSWALNFDDIQLLEREIRVQNVITTRLLISPEFDQASYGPGDLVKFELAVRNISDEPLIGSKVNYKVRLAGTPLIEGETITNEKGKAYIEFSLPEDLSQTDVIINATVKGDRFEESVARSVPVVLNRVVLNFYPEGGHSVPGKMSMIGFEAIDEYGNGADIKGTIFDDQGKELLQFASEHEGMGAFQLQYEVGKSYYTKLMSPSIPTRFKLPEAGFMPVLTLIEQNPEQLTFKAVGWTDQLKLEGYCRGKLWYESEMQDSVKSLSIEKFPPGIARFVLKNKAGSPYSERLVFLKRDQSFDVKIETDKTKYAPGDLVTLNIETRDSSGEAVPMKLGISVVDDQLISFANDQSDNILSYFYLSSELKSKIENPTYYFDPEEENSERALDLLMMIKGWANYSWKLNEKATLKYLPEKITNVRGRLVNGKGNPVQGVVYAVESHDKRRMVEVETTAEGYFLIKNFNAKNQLHLITRKPNKIIVEDSRAIAPKPGRGVYWWSGEYNLYDEIYFDEINVSTNTTPDSDSDNNNTEGLSISLSEDTNSLEEVVVVGYGAVNKSNLTSCTVTIWDAGLNNFSTMGTLQGKVAGVVVTQQHTDITIPQLMTLRGNQSVGSGDGAPLVVLNGFELSPSQSRHFMNSELFTPDQLQSITYLNSPEARLQYGNKAGNGIIFLESKFNIGSRNYHYETKKGKFNGVTITKYEFSIVRDAYEITSRQSDGVRAETGHLVYWNPNIMTDEKGKAEIKFRTNDAISTFRITAEGISADGGLGRSEQTYYTVKPLNLDVKLPHQVGFEDQIMAHAMLSNQTNKVMNAVLEVTMDSTVVFRQDELQIAPGKSMEVPVLLEPPSRTGDTMIRFELRSGFHMDRLEQKIQVFPIGFESRISQSGSNPNTQFKFQIRNPERGTVAANLTIFPDVISDLESGAKSLFREPHGCFEQVSSTTYPNVLALQYLNSTMTKDQQVSIRALNYISSGYKKLTAYEVKGGGFEWFGHAPAHEGLTAFGLIQFNQMKEVYDEVDSKMMDRTIGWLLSRRDQKGGFKQNRGKYGFSAASKEVTNAYIVYALSELGESQIVNEFSASLQEVYESGDHYRMALIANAAYNLNETLVYKKLVDEFESHVDKFGMNDFTVDHSLVRSYGQDLQTETVALWTLALLKSHHDHIALISKMVDYLMGKRVNGRFGSTQATGLALQAIAQFNLIAASTKPSGEIEVWLNGNWIHSVSTEDMRGLHSFDFAQFLNLSKENVLELKYPHKDTKMPYAVEVSWLNKNPEANESSVQLESRLEKSEVVLNETIRMNNQIRNISTDGLPMTVLRLGIPGGLSLQFWQLEELMEKRIFDYYEIVDEDLVLYFKELGPGQEINVPLDLKAEVAGTYIGRASSAYLYYSDSRKCWNNGHQIQIVKQ